MVEFKKIQRVQKNYWKKFNNVKNTIFKLKKEHNGWPGSRYVIKNYSALSHGIFRHHGGFTKVMKKLHILPKQIHKENGYWKNENNVLKEINRIIKLYNGWPGSYIIHLKHSALSHAIERYHKIGLRKYIEKLPRPDREDETYNEKRIYKWSENLAYFVGLIATDGCITIKRNCVTIGLLSTDASVLEKLHRWFGLKNHLTNCKTQSGNYSTRLSIHGKHMLIFLIKSGVSSYMKSYNQDKLNIPNKYFHHCLRGIIDGDGSIFPTRKTITISLVGTQNLLNYIRENINKFLNFELPIERVRHVKNKMYGLRLYGRKAIKLRNFIYKNSNIYIKRKRASAYGKNNR